MSDIRALWELQNVDLDLSAHEAQLQEIEARLAGWEELDHARQELAARRQRLQQLESEQRQQQWKVEDLRRKRDTERERLYGGSVRNPRELTSLQEEVWQLEKRCQEEEDRLLELMLTVEEAQTELADQEARVAAMEAEWVQVSGELAATAERLRREARALQERRQQLAGSVAPASLGRYEALRHRGNGRAVALIEQGRCQGCRIELPSSLIQQARQSAAGGRDLVQCQSCGRLLYVP
jgi:predicted  nucleic acid-binding Zn-ribbon protein